MIEHEAPFKKFPPTIARLESIEITPKSHNILFTRAITVQSAGGDNVALADGVKPGDLEPLVCYRVEHQAGVLADPLNELARKVRRGTANYARIDNGIRVKNVHERRLVKAINRSTECGNQFMQRLLGKQSFEVD